MTTGPDHYREAERLIEEGQQTVTRIAAVHEDPLSTDEVRARRDDLGKKAMGIWAQAQVHATLASAAATALAGTISNTMAPSHPINQTAHDDETIRAVNDWHETSRATDDLDAGLHDVAPRIRFRMWDRDWNLVIDPDRARTVTVDRPDGSLAILTVTARTEAV